MRRFLLIFLMLLLPLQLSWAAMAPYCIGEPAAAAASQKSHIGHHAHRTGANQQAQSLQAQTAQASFTQDTAPVDQIAADAECGLCHLSCCKSLVTVAPAEAALGFGLASYPALAPRFSSHIANGPDKPDWQRPA